MTPFKNNISLQLVELIADHLELHLVGFDRHGFTAPICDELQNLELKARAQLISGHLQRVLPAELEHRYEVVRALFHPDEDSNMGMDSDTTGLRGWGMLPFGMVIGQSGLSDFTSSLELLKEMTKRCSAEFDIRPFLIADQEAVLDIIQDWVEEPNMHVRRLVSEGTRPRLPWGERLPRLIADPSPMLPLLEKLRDDSTEYVRRSVANHLNDIAKDHPDLVAEIAANWMRGANVDRQRLVRHACRTLIKQGHPRVLSAFGLHPPKLEMIELLVKRDKILMGGALEFELAIRSTAKTDQNLIIDYVVHFLKANGSLSAKVFKWKQLTLPAGASVGLTRSHKFVPITTRKYHFGIHALSMRINGKDFGFVEFSLLPSR